MNKARFVATAIFVFLGLLALYSLTGPSDTSQQSSAKIDAAQYIHKIVASEDLPALSGQAEIQNVTIYSPDPKGKQPQPWSPGKDDPHWPNRGRQ